MGKKAAKQDEVVFNTGAKRSVAMPRYDLIPKTALDRLAERFTGSLNTEGDPDGGALKYGECNWMKGLPTSDTISHVLNHVTAYAEEFRRALFEHQGDMSRVMHRMRDFSKRDDELAGAMWGLSVLMEQERLGEMYHDDRFEVEIK